MSKRIRLLSLLMRTGEFERSAAAAAAIREGQVRVDSQVMKEPGHSIKMLARVEWNGKQLKPRPLTYILLNKPAGTVCQKSVKEKTIYDIVANIPEIDKKTKNSLFCVGRLDKETTGLLVVTNDGQLQRLLTRGGVVKMYLAETATPVTEEQLARLRDGVEIKDDDTGKVFLVKAVVAKKREGCVEVGIDEGRKRQVRKMFQSVGNEVIQLERVGIGRLRLSDLHGKPYHIISKKELKLPGKL